MIQTQGTWVTNANDTSVLFRPPLVRPTYKEPIYPTDHSGPKPELQPGQGDHPERELPQCGRQQHHPEATGAGKPEIWTFSFPV